MFILESRRDILTEQQVAAPLANCSPAPGMGGSVGEGRAGGGGGCDARLAELAAASEMCKDNTEQLRAPRFADHQQFLPATGGLQLPRQLP